MSRGHHPVYLWNPVIHDEWANETLHFYRITFAPKLEKRAVIETLTKFLGQQGITAYEWNETYGSTDLILRLWLRPEHRPTAFPRTIGTALDNVHCKQADGFHVDELYYHWRWTKKTTPPAIDYELIREVNTGKTSTKTKKAQTAHLIQPFGERDGKIHFYIGIPSTQGQKIAEHLPRQILTRYQHHPTITQLAIYTGSGGLYEILIEGKVTNAHYGAIAELSNYLNAIGCYYAIKTETLLVTGNKKGSFYVADTLSIEAPEPLTFEERDYRAYAETGEDHTLEMKGTLYTDINRYLVTGQKTKSVEYMNGGPLKGIVSMLNSARGGQMIIGLLEDTKLPAKGREQLDHFEKIDNFYVIGVQSELNYRSWDDYHRQLREAIDNTIKPSPAAMNLYDIKKIPAGKASLAVITIQPAPPEEWFTINDKIYVRNGPQTHTIRTAELPRHQRARERAWQEQTKKRTNTKNVRKQATKI